MLRGHRDLKAYQLAYSLAMDIFHLSRMFPREERYSLTDQIRRSSRSVPANLAEAYRKRRYPAMFVNKLTDCDAEASETQVWVEFARDCGYLPTKEYQQLSAGYEELGRLLNGMLVNAAKFTINSA